MTDGQEKAIEDLTSLINELADTLEQVEESVHSAAFQLRYVATKHLLQIHWAQSQCSKEDAHERRMAEIERKYK